MIIYKCDKCGKQCENSNCAAQELMHVTDETIITDVAVYHLDGQRGVEMCIERDSVDLCVDCFKELYKDFWCRV